MNYSEKRVMDIPLEDIIPNPFQPRLAFNEDKIQELAESIKTHGIIEPLILRKNGDKYEIVAGERRYKAATMAGLATVPSIVTDMDNNKSAEIALVENLQRKNLTAIEEAKSYEKLRDRGYSQDDIAKKMGVSQPSIANKLRLLNLADEVQRALLEEKISERHARSLLTLDKESQVLLLTKVINDRLTVRQLDEEILRMQNNPTQTQNNEPIPSTLSSSTADLEELFSAASVGSTPIATSEAQKSDELEVFNIPPIVLPQNVSTPLEDNFFEPVDHVDITAPDKQPIVEEEVDPTNKTDELSFPEPIFTKIDEAEEQKIIQQNNIIISKEDFSTVIRSFDKLKRDIEDAGLQISMETFNFDEYYQLIIKVYKN